MPSRRSLQMLREGIALGDRITAPAQVKILEGSENQEGCDLELCVHEGRKHQIKRMCEAVGHRVTALHRVAFAGLTTAALQPGQYRPLEKDEVDLLQSLVGL